MTNVIKKLIKDGVEYEIQGTSADATSSTKGLVKLGSDTTQTTAANNPSSTANRTYPIQTNSSGQMVVNVPWEDSQTGSATSSVAGTLKLGSDTTQTTAANEVSSTASRTYALQTNSSGQGVVNVPWENTTYSAGNEIEISNNVIKNISYYVIPESIVTVTTTDEYGVAPYNTSYYYTNIEINANAGIEWKEGATYVFLIDTTMVVASAYRNVRIRIGSTGDWKPLMGSSSSITSGSSYFIKNRTDLWVYKTTQQSNGALHLQNDTSYSAMSVAEGTTGTATSARTMRADYLKQIIQAHSIIPSKSTGQTVTCTSTSSTTPLSVTSKATSGSAFIAFNGKDGYLASYGVNSSKKPIFYDGSSNQLAIISGSQYGSSWSGVADKSPSQNAVYNKIESMDTTISGKQDALTSQTAYTSKGSATKVPQITTNSLGQVTGITEVTITQPTVNNSTITFTQGGNSIGTMTTNQSSAGTLAFYDDIPVTQSEYDALPSSKTTDGNTYLIYATS